MVRSGRKKASGLVTAVLLLGGCAGPSASPWRTAAPAPPIEGPQQAVFCYKTLADVACYFEPDRTVPGQLVAVYPRAVGDPWSTASWRRPAAPEATEGSAPPARSGPEPGLAP